MSLEIIYIIQIILFSLQNIKKNYFFLIPATKVEKKIEKEKILILKIKFILKLNSNF